VEEMNLEKNDEQDGHYMKEKYFQDIIDESRTKEVVGNNEKDECILIFEIPHPIKDNNILEKPRIDFIELWFQRIVGQTMQSDSQHTWLHISPVQIKSAPESLV
jgi:hypothetical protein